MTANLDRDALLRRLRNDVPDAPGVYLFYGPSKELLYIGKSVRLRRRMSGYFQGDPSRLEGRIRRLIFNIHDFEWIECASDLAALLLEDELIKARIPPYNRKQKEFPLNRYLVLTDDPYPTLMRLDSLDDFPPPAHRAVRSVPRSTLRGQAAGNHGALSPSAVLHRLRAIEKGDKAKDTEKKGDQCSFHGLAFFLELNAFLVDWVIVGAFAACGGLSQLVCLIPTLTGKEGCKMHSPMRTGDLSLPRRLGGSTRRLQPDVSVTSFILKIQGKRADRDRMDETRFDPFSDPAEKAVYLSGSDGRYGLIG